MGGRVEVDPERVRALASGFKDAAQTVGGMSSHDSAEQISTGLTATAVGGACAAAGTAADTALAAVSGGYHKLHTHAHNGANDYVDTDTVSADEFGAAEKSV
ncbi:hypothetical protein GFY24_08740 [Nocardia sp. SYP-A9097]|uniref:type VII secretion target n=1 Tax=Nocardia sp. SYP-A9097 TaxID=2663237 RepID=UPI00129ABB09|nr:type VII secretion target [Nocardia sp. SYP-A9097]MRH87541.1 hypothetical protein [Nocardia sp. SYP-A9097]